MGVDPYFHSIHPTTVRRAHARAHFARDYELCEAAGDHPPVLDHRGCPGRGASGFLAQEVLTHSEDHQVDFGSGNSPKCAIN